MLVKMVSGAEPMCRRKRRRSCHSQIVKNSYGTTFGESGFARVKMEGDGDVSSLCSPR
jgi:hypothetical protein